VFSRRSLNFAAKKRKKMDGPEPAFFARVMYGDEDILELGVDQERFREIVDRELKQSKKRK